MPWEYLSSPEFDARLLPIAEALKPFVTGARVVDLNCGTALMAALLRGYADYYGNDLCAEFVSKARARGIPNTAFEQVPDAQIDRPCDVLLYLGMGCGEFTGEPLESSTGTESFFRLVGKRPKAVALEMVREWQERFGAADRMRDRMEAQGYHVIASGEVDIPGAVFYHKRQWMVFTAGEGVL